MKGIIGRNGVLSLIFVSLILAGCFSGGEKAQRPTVVGYLPIIAHLPAFIAESDGLLADVEFRVFPSSNDLMQALITGEVDIATTVATAPFLAGSIRFIESGAELPAMLFSISSTGLTEPFDGVFVRHDSPLQSLSDLENRRIGVFPGTTARRMLSYVLSTKFDVDTSTIQWVMLPPSAQLEALATNDIDVLYTYETVRTTAALGGFREIYGSVIAEAQNGAPYGASAVNRTFFDQRTEEALSFIRAFDSGILVVRNQPSYARDVLRFRLRLPERVAAECNLERRLTLSETQGDRGFAKLERFARLLVEIGEIDSEEVLPLTDIIVPTRVSLN